MVRSRRLRRAAPPLILASVALAAVQWVQVAVGLSGTTAAWCYMIALPLNLVLTLGFPRWKARVVRCVQRWLVNPPIRWLLHVGIMPLGYALLETHGRKTGRLRRTPVGKGVIDGTFWLVAEHGVRADYVRNIQHDPRVRVRMRVGRRFRWVNGTASLHPELDPAAVQRRLAMWHPLRAFNAMQVQVLGSSLLVVRIDLHTTHRPPRGKPHATATAGGHSPGGHSPG